MDIHSKRGRTRYPGIIEDKVVFGYLLREGLGYTRLTGSSWSIHTQRLEMKKTGILNAIYWDLKSGTYQFSFAKVGSAFFDYDIAHVIPSNTTDAKWDLRSYDILLEAGNQYDFRMTRSGSTNIWDNDNQGSFDGLLWKDITYFYNTIAYPQYCCPMELEVFVTG